MKKIAGIGSVVDVDFGSKGVKKCEIVRMKQSGIGVRIVPNGTKVYEVAQSKLIL